jgi:hypothetical protein
VKLRKEIEFAFSGFCLFVCLGIVFCCKPLFGCGDNKGKIKICKILDLTLLLIRIWRNDLTFQLRCVCKGFPFWKLINYVIF